MKFDIDLSRKHTCTEL